MYQFFTQILQPYTLLLFGILTAVVWAWLRKQYRRKAILLACLLFGILFFLSTPLAGFLALFGLEGGSRTAVATPGPGDTIVVLSGSIRRDDDAGEHFRVGPDTFYRCDHAVGLYRACGHCRLVLSGGKVNFSEPGPTLARVMRDFVLELGVKPNDVVLEERSSTTFENASYSKDLLEGKEGRVFLVTDAAHMPRAQHCFRVQGITVIPAPCNYRALRMEWSGRTLLPSADGIHAVNDAAHEWLGLIWYRLRYFGQA